MHIPFLPIAEQYKEETIEDFTNRYLGFGKNIYALLKEKIPFLYTNLFFYSGPESQPGDSYAVYGNDSSGFAIHLAVASEVIVLWNKEKHIEIGTWTENPEEETVQKIISDFYMHPIEIKQDKKESVLGPFIFAVVVVITMCCVILFTEEVSLSNYLFALGFSFLALYSVYKTIDFSSKNIAILTLSREYIILNDDGKPISFLWTEIIQHKIENDNSTDTPSLKLRVVSNEKSKSVNISSLEKTSAEIEKLIAEYKTAAHMDFVRSD